MIQKLKFASKNKKEILIYFFLFIVMLVLCRSSITRDIKPFGFAFSFALVYLGKNPFVVSLFYFISYIIYDFSFDGIIIAINAISSIILLYLIFKLLKKKINLTFTLIFSLISQVAYIYFNLNNLNDILSIVLMLVTGMIFIYITIIAFGAVFFRGVQSRYTMDEIICFSLLLIAFFSGLSSIYLFNINITTLIVSLLIFISSRVFSKITTISLAVLAGFGTSVAFGGVTYIAVYTCWGIMSAILSDKSKFTVPIFVIFLDIILGFALMAYPDYTFINMIPLFISTFIYFIIPNKFYLLLTGFSYKYDGNLINEYVLNGEQQLIKKRILKVSELFKQMQICYRNLSVGGIDRESACEFLANELIKGYCTNCLKYNECLENFRIKDSVKELFSFGMERGKINLIDANNLLTTSCNHLTGMIGQINNSLENYFKYEEQIKNQDCGKMLISEQLGGTSELLSEMSLKTFSEKRRNDKLSRELLDELTLNQVIVNEVSVLDGDFGVEKVIVVVRNSDVLSPNILYTLQSIYRINFIKIESFMSRHAGWSILVFVPAPKYSLSFGYSGCSKDGNAISGDCYSISKLNENKMLVAISDGMGHGEKANDISTVALSLIENFYKVGFDSKTIISSVNKILLPSSQENFTTLDACIVDVSNGTVDFVKIGSSVSVIKSSTNYRAVTTDSLPLGIVGLVSPKAQKFVLKSDDIIVLASDGIVDCFDSIEDFCLFVNNEKVINMQMLADNILEEAISRESNHKDDKTVITIKIKQNYKTN